MDSPFDGDDLSAALGTETLAGKKMVPEGFDSAPNSRDNMPIELIGGRRFLRIDQTANLYVESRYRRSGNTVSSIAHSIMSCMTNIGAAGKLITERNALADTTTEATECLKA
jgi:hypothetical protein